MSDVPLPLRIAAGLVVTALEQARKLPDQLADLPVTAASRAIQAGMRVQQRVTELAIKGDQVFSLLRPVEDTPPWARFDEDESPQSSPEAGAQAEPQAGTGWSAMNVPVGPGAQSGNQPGTAGGEVNEGDVAKALTPSRGNANGTRPAPTSEPSEPLPGYGEMSVAELRTTLRELSLPQLEALLNYERAHQDRPAFVTLLSNRISTVRSQ
jgi:hypothetical protein